MSQTSYKINLDKAVAGLRGDMNPARIMNFINPVDKALFGQVMSRASSGNFDAQQPATSGDVLIGVVVRALAHESNQDGLNSLAPGSAVPIMTDGTVWMATQEAVAVGDTPYIVYAATRQVLTLVLSTDLITANVITTTVNGKSVASTFASSHSATFSAHAALIAALDGVLSAVASSDTITITAEDDSELVVTSVVTLGSSQPTVTITETVPGAPSTDRGRLRNDSNSSHAMSAAGLLEILDYDSVTQLALVRVVKTA